MLISQMNEEAALQLELGSALSPVREGGPRRPGGMGAVPPGTWTVSGGEELGEDLRKPPNDASPSAEIEFTLSEKWFSRRFPSAMPVPVGCGGVHRTRQ
jgi:hypothetical protein